MEPADLVDGPADSDSWLEVSEEEIESVFLRPHSIPGDGYSD